MGKNALQPREGGEKSVDAIDSGKDSGETDGSVDPVFEGAHAVNLEIVPVSDEAVEVLKGPPEESAGGEEG